MVMPWLSANSANYAEDPYDCSFNKHVGIGAEVSILGVKIKADANGFVRAEYGNIAYSCSRIGVGCTKGFTCVEFWNEHARITMPDVE